MVVSDQPSAVSHQKLPIGVHRRSSAFIGG
jgi:hypothetical protein